MGFLSTIGGDCWSGRSEVLGALAEVGVAVETWGTDSWAADRLFLAGELIRTAESVWVEVGTGTETEPGM